MKEEVLKRFLREAALNCTEEYFKNQEFMKQLEEFCCEENKEKQIEITLAIKFPKEKVEN